MMIMITMMLVVRVTMLWAIVMVLVVDVAVAAAVVDVALLSFLQLLLGRP